MNKQFLSWIFILVLPFYAQTQQAEWAWVQQAGSNNYEYCHSLTTDTYENIYVTGNLYSEIILGPDTLVSNGGSDIYIAKYDKNSNFIWAKQIGGAHSDFSYRIKIDHSNNLIITGLIGGSGIVQIGDTSFYVHGDTDIFLAKYDNNGNFLWARTAGGNYSSYQPSSWDCGRSVDIDRNNNIFITGSFRDTAVFESDTIISYGGIDAFIAKYSQDGQLIWVDNYGSSSADNGNVVKVNNADDLFVTGWFEDTIQIADTVLVPHNNMNNFILKLTNAGDRIWIKQIAGSKAYSYNTSIIPDNSENLYVTDYFDDTLNLNDTTLIADGNIDFYISKYDRDGTFLWARQYFEVFNIQSTCLTIDHSNNLYIGGSFNGNVKYQNDTLFSTSGIADIFAAKFDGSGNLVWIIPAGGTLYDTGMDIAWNKHVYLSGWFNQTATFGVHSITAFNARDGFFARIDEVPSQINLKSKSANFQIYPNPCINILKIKFNGLEKGSKLRITNLNGQVVYRKKLTDSTITIDISALRPGIYFVCHTSETNSQTQKMIKL
ncbi:MAG: T9SS type A sorting domain-containing protein [Bacteroidota bacterium]